MAGAKKFKIGDVVRLKSGGADMTVVSEPNATFGEALKVRCSWHAGKKHESHEYPVDALELVPPKAEPK